ncbi:DUF6234 family protein [Streptomyces sp. NPDC059534]|uniref:DUF6234 family protein n=1 Tax=Streptomyces sp. NPDC059534 TaxID=3346859 RepID=UPI0036AFADAB
MDLPIAPPAFDASVRTRPGRGADVGVAVGLMLLEGIVLLVTFGFWLLSGVSLDPGRTVSPDPLGGYLVAAGVVGALTAVAAVIAARSRAVVTAATQGFVTLVVVIGVAGGVAVERQEGRTDHPAPAPIGEVGCRSGGDSRECANTGG